MSTLTDRAATAPSCPLCGPHPATYRFRYFAGERLGQVVECCLHEYQARLTHGEDLALVLGQEIKSQPRPAVRFAYNGPRSL